MCRNICTYRKYIKKDNGYFDCTQNPHIILAAKGIQSGQNFSTINPSGPAQSNLYSTSFHPVYLEIYNQWSDYIDSGSLTSYILTPTPNPITQPGTYDGYNPVGVPQTFATNLVQTFPTLNMTPNLPVGGFIAYSPPPFQFAENLMTSEYVPSFNYEDYQLGINPSSSDDYILVEFLDVNGLYCKGA